MGKNQIENFSPADLVLLQNRYGQLQHQTLDVFFAKHPQILANLPKRRTHQNWQVLQAISDLIRTAFEDHQVLLQIDCIMDLHEFFHIGGNGTINRLRKAPYHWVFRKQHRKDKDCPIAFPSRGNVLRSYYYVPVVRDVLYRQYFAYLKNISVINEFMLRFGQCLRDADGGQWVNEGQQICAWFDTTKAVMVNNLKRVGDFTLFDCPRFTVEVRDAFYASQNVLVANHQTREKHEVVQPEVAGLAIKQRQVFLTFEYSGLLTSREQSVLEGAFRLAEKDLPPALRNTIAGIGGGETWDQQVSRKAWVNVRTNVFDSIMTANLQYERTLSGLYGQVVADVVLEVQEGLNELHQERRTLEDELKAHVSELTLDQTKIIGKIALNHYHKQIMDAAGRFLTLKKHLAAALDLLNGAHPSTLHGVVRNNLAPCDQLLQNSAQAWQAVVVLFNQVIAQMSARKKRMDLSKIDNLGPQIFELSIG